MSTMQRKIQEGEKRGIQLGEKRGIQLGEKKMLKKLIDRGIVSAEAVKSLRL